MFVADRLIYLQLQKTGCTHIAKLLEQSVGGKQLKKHSRIADPAACAGKTIVGSIRNPWDWYVSLWAFGCAGEGGIHHAVTRRRWLRSFAEEWRETYRDRNDPKLFRQWLRLMMDPRRRRDMGGILSDGPLFAGVYTHRYVWLHWRELTPVHSLEELRQTDASNNLLNAIIHTESLESDLIRVLAQAGYQVDAQRILTAGKTNTSTHRDAGDYYDAETIELVAQKDRFLVEKYGYTQPLSR